MSTVYKIIIGGIYFAAVSLFLAGCNLQLNEQVATPNASEIIQTTEGITTQQALAPQPSQIQFANTATPQVITPASTLNETEVVRLEGLAITATVMCDRAKPGIPVDVTVPDDTRMQPGEMFTKIWRFQNDGSCTWTKDYAVVWFSGDELGADNVQTFGEAIQPGASADVNVEMVAPVEPGIYSSYWMMRNKQGELFGLGPNGNAPFWVRIQVVAVNTATPTATVEPTATPIVQISGNSNLEEGQTFDLDNGKLAQGNQDDLSLTLEDENMHKLLPVNNALLGVFGQLRPAEVDCRGAILSNDPLDLSTVEAGDYICYRTNQGLPGSLYIIQLPNQEDVLNFDYVTWAAR